MTRDEVLRKIAEAKSCGAKFLSLNFGGLTELLGEIGQLTNLERPG